MGWFSNLLYGERKSIEPNKLNSYMEPYLKMINEQEDIFKQQMDPNSLLNQTMQNNMLQQNLDLQSQQNLSTQGTAAMQGVSPGQITQMIHNQNTANRGQFGNQMQNFMTGQFQAGLGGLGGIAQARKGEGERLSNMHIQEVNAHNARRQSNMDMGMSLLGMAIGAGGTGKPPQLDPDGNVIQQDPTNIWGGSWTPFQQGGRGHISSWFNNWGQGSPTGGGSTTSQANSGLIDFFGGGNPMV